MAAKRDDRPLRVTKVTFVRDESEMATEERRKRVIEILAQAALRTLRQKRNTVEPKNDSVNSISIIQLRMACRHVEELMNVGITENLAIRTLELLVDVYSKVQMGGSATPHHVRQVKHWSKAALKLKSPETLRNAKDFFRVEHGTPRRQLARKVLALAQKKRLTDITMGKLVERHWKLAVITLEEDERLNKIARSKMFESPDERWAAAGIKF